VILDSEDPAHAEVIAIREGNLVKMKYVEAHGLQVQMSGRLEGLIELLLDSLIGNSPERVLFEKTYAEAESKMLDQAETQIRMAVLAQGPTPNGSGVPNGLIGGRQ
jgi:hypothetical protein